MLTALMASGSVAGQEPEDLAARAAAIRARIDAAGGWQAIAERLAPWRAAVAERIAAVPPARKGGGYIANDAPIDGGDGWLLSARRARQLLYETAVDGPDPQGERRYALAERALHQAHADCAARGIRLVVVIAPDKSDVHPERLAPLPADVPTVNLRTHQLILRLLEAGVDVVDAENHLRTAARDADTPLYMQRDTHWSPTGSRLCAELVADRLDEFRQRGKGFQRRPDQLIERQGDLAENWRRRGAVAFPPERHRHIGVCDAQGRPVPTLKDAPVLVLGDSYSTFPYNGFLSFWAFLAEGLGRPVAQADQAGGGNTALRAFNRLPPTRQQATRAIVLLFTNCALYEVDFPLVRLHDAPPRGLAVRQARVTLQAAPPAIDPATADYADAIAGVPALVDRGDGLPVAAQIHVPLMRARRLLAAAAWRKGQELRLDLHHEAPPGQGGVMVLEADPDPSRPVLYVVDLATGATPIPSPPRGTDHPDR